MRAGDRCRCDLCVPCPIDLGVGFPWLGIKDTEPPAPARVLSPTPAPESVTGILDRLDLGVFWPALRPAHQVHNHGPSEGRGLDCPEQRGADGLLRGACVAPRERWRYVGRLPWGQRSSYDLFELVANPAAGRHIGDTWANVVPA